MFRDVLELHIGVWEKLFKENMTSNETSFSKLNISIDKIWIAALKLYLNNIL